MIRTFDNCSVRFEGLKRGIGEPEQLDGRCLGYAESKHAINRCVRCPLYVGTRQGVKL